MIQVKMITTMTIIKANFICRKNKGKKKCIKTNPYKKNIPVTFSPLTLKMNHK